MSEQHEERHRTNIYLPLEMLDELRALAKLNNRSLNGEMIERLQRSIENEKRRERRKREVKPPPKKE